MAQSVADKLDEARALIEKGWAKNNWGYDASGKPVCYDSDAAVCVCARAAIWRVANDGAVELAFEKAVGTYDIAAWNDAPERTQAEVIDAFKRAAELARGEQA